MEYSDAHQDGAPMFLDEDNLVRLTGKSRPSAQRRWLLDNGWPHEINGLQKPLVLESVVQERLGGTVSPKQSPNFEAMNDG